MDSPPDSISPNDELKAIIPPQIEQEIADANAAIDSAFADLHAEEDHLSNPMSDALQGTKETLKDTGLIDGGGDLMHSTYEFTKQPVDNVHNLGQQLSQEMVGGGNHSPLGSSDSNEDYVKVRNPLSDSPILNTDITPSDEVSPPIGEDFDDFAPSPQEAASELVDAGQRAFEDFMSSSGAKAQELAKNMQDSPNVGASPVSETSPREPLEGFYRDDSRDRPQEEEESTFDRRGPLTLPQPIVPPSPEAPNLDEFDPIKPEFHAKEPVIEYSPPSPEPPVLEDDLPPPFQAPNTPISYEGGKGPWFDFKSMDPRVVDLIYWRDIKKSGIAFGVTLVLLICLRCFSIVSVFAYAGLITLAFTLSFRIYKIVLGTVQKTEQGNPFKPYLDSSLNIPVDRVHQQVDVLIKHVQEVANQLSKLLLVEDLVDSIKFGALLWALTYVGCWFSGMTLIILAFIGLFTLPKVYELYQGPIDQYYGVAHGHVKKVTDQVQEKMPFLKSKQQ